MQFYVPTVDGSEHMVPGEDEKQLQACRKEAELSVGRSALARRVYRLEYEHDGKSMNAQVGEPLRAYCDCELVMAIIAFPDCYKICCVVNGYLEVAATPIVELRDTIDAEDFD
jgi:hypothetical protein